MRFLLQQHHGLSLQIHAIPVLADQTLCAADMGSASVFQSTSVTRTSLAARSVSSMMNVTAIALVFAGSAATPARALVASTPAVMLSTISQCALVQKA